MTKRLLIIGLLPVLALLLSGSASAHVLEADGTIGAVLHIKPDDSPVSGTPITYVLAFNDTSGKLRLPDCDCMVAIQENGKTISAKPLVATGELDSSNTVTFPKADVYTLEVTGKPKTDGAFQPFKLVYSVRVTSGTAQVQSMPLMLWIGMAGMIGLVLLAAYAMEVGYTDSNGKDKREGV